MWCQQYVLLIGLRGKADFFAGTKPSPRWVPGVSPKPSIVPTEPGLTPGVPFPQGCSAPRFPPTAWGPAARPPEPLLTRGIPDLELDAFAWLDLDQTGEKIHPHRGVRNLGEAALGEAADQTGLAHRGIPDDNEPKLVQPDGLHGWARRSPGARGLGLGGDGAPPRRPRRRRGARALERPREHCWPRSPRRDRPRRRASERAEDGGTALARSLAEVMKWQQHQHHALTHHRQPGYSKAPRRRDVPPAALSGREAHTESAAKTRGPLPSNALALSASPGTWSARPLDGRTDPADPGTRKASS